MLSRASTERDLVRGYAAEKPRGESVDLLYKKINESN